MVLCGFFRHVGRQTIADIIGLSLTDNTRRFSRAARWYWASPTNLSIGSTSSTRAQTKPFSIEDNLERSMPVPRLIEYWERPANLEAEKTFR